MAKFIQVHHHVDDKRVLINIDKTQMMMEYEGNAVIYFDHMSGSDEQECLVTREDYDEVMQMIASGTGGIPMGG